MNPERTYAFVTNATYVVVASNPIIEILEPGTNATTPHDKTTYVGNLTVYSSGNDRVKDITLSHAGGNFDSECFYEEPCELTLVPNASGDLLAGYNFTVDVWVDVPKGVAPGVYWTFVVVNSSNDGSDQHLLNLTVPMNTSWTRTPDSFPTVIAQPNTNGLIGKVNVTNFGNVKIYFEAVKREAAGPLLVVTPEGFSSDIKSIRTINISYSVPAGYPEGLYYGVVAIRNDTLPADPVEQTISLWLNVTDLPPNITNYTIEPMEFEAGFETVHINATIIDNIDVASGWIDVERPGDINYISVFKQIISANNSGFNHTEEMNYSGVIQYFNITIYNNESSHVYVNITVNGALIVSNQSIENSTNFTIDAVQAGASFTLPGNQTINITFQNASGSVINSSYVSWLGYRVKSGEIYRKMMDRNGDEFNTTYWTNISGYHKLRICANDTSSQVGCTDVIYLLAAGNTTIEISPNITSMNVTNITIYQGEEIHVEFNISNAGHARAYNVTLNISYPENWSVSPVNFSFGTIYKSNYSSNMTAISIPPATPPGVYFVNLTANWTNINTSYPGINTTAILINVTANPVIDLQDRIPGTGEVIVTAGTKKNVTFNVNSTGNANITNVIFNCTEGIVCSNFTNFTESFEPQNISVLVTNTTRSVNLTLSVPWNYPAGHYNGTIVAIGDGTNDSSPIYVNIPENISWVQEPSNITREVIQGTQGHFGDITVRNNGNVFVTLSVIPHTGDIWTHIDWTPDEMELDIGETDYINITYNAPVTQSRVTYTGIMWTYNGSADPSYHETFLNLTIHPYFVNIISPTEANPKLNVSPTDEIEVKVNVTYGITNIGENVTFDISLYNSTTKTYVSITSANYNSSEGLWHVNFTAPALSLQRGYDLNVTAIYSLTPDQNVTYYDVEPKAVVYKDEIPPSISISVPARVPANTTARIYANVTDPGGVANASIVVYDPNGTAEYGNMTFLYRDEDTYVFRYDYANTSKIGIYSINVTGCDKTGNCNSTNTSFEIYIGVWFSGYAKDIWRIRHPVINQSFWFYDDAGNLLINFSSDPDTGYYNESVDARIYDLKTKVWGDSVTLFTVPLLQDVHNPIQFGNISKYVVSAGGAGVHRSIIVNNSLNYSL
ncbi:MAG: hypothetical protein DRP45_11790, partial [Candidatus Zixiibacteriota bacterium]